jgi:hypothetical protein
MPEMQLEFKYCEKLFKILLFNRINLIIIFIFINIASIPKVRAAMGVETISGEKGYLDSPEPNYAKMEAVVDAAMKNCMQVFLILFL